MKVFPTTYGVEVFANDAGSITIKQEDAFGGDDDSFVVVPADRVAALILALRQAKREALED